MLNEGLLSLKCCGVCVYVCVCMCECVSLFKKPPVVMGGCDFSYDSYKPPATGGFQMIAFLEM